mmetsp:Transcript_3895/g.11719  ORF Transcript_3895/g.11719 Transcript_3895/m.11719 type:complete len:256 (-) Transcript_3895:1204-1971(-)
MGGHVIDDLLRVRCVGDTATVGIARDHARVAVAVLLQDVPLEAPDQRQAHLVGRDENLSPLLFGVSLLDAGVLGPWPKKQTRGETLGPGVDERRPSQRCVAHPVVERTQARTGEVPLHCHFAALVARNLAELPTLAVQQHVLPIDAIRLLGEGVQCGPAALQAPQRQVPHQVEAESVDPVFLGPMHQAIDHEPFHHRALGRRVVHAGRLLVSAALGPAVVIAWHALVQHALGPCRAAGECVIVDDIQHDAKALCV